MAIFLKLDDQSIAVDYKSGLSIHQLASKYDTSRVTIKRRLLKQGIQIQTVILDMKKHRESSAPGKYSQVLGLYKSGLSVDEIAKKLSVHNGKIYDTLRRHGITIEVDYQQIMEGFAKNSRKDWDNADKLYELYINQSKSIGELVEILHADEYTIKTVLQKYGIPTRNLIEANKLTANKPENRAMRSIIAKKMWENEDFRNNIISKLRGSHPQMPPEHAEHVSAAMKLLYTNNEYYEKHCEQVRKLWENPTPAMLKNLYETIRMMQDASSDLKKKFNDVIHTPEHLDNLSQKSLESWSNPIFLAEKLPIMKLKIAEAVRNSWKDPVYREKVMSKKKFISRLEYIAREILDDLRIKYRKICPSGYEFDLCIEPSELGREKGLLIEINGLYYHHNKSRDKDKFLFWKNNLSDKYDFETIWEFEYGAHQSLYDRICKLIGKHKDLQVDLGKITFGEVDSVSAERLYNKYHYLAHLRRGKHFGAYYDKILIGSGTFSTVTRNESITRLKLNPNEIRELTRFCIHPVYKNPNLASYLLSNFLRLYHNFRPETRILITFADQFMGHVGTIYKATNWVSDGQTNSSYFYIRDGYHYDKRTVYGYAKSIGITEGSFIDRYGFERVNTPPKYRFIYQY